MMVQGDARRQGLGEQLMRAVETAARDLGRTLLVLDTETASDGERLYERLGWVRVGVIPDFAVTADGGFGDCTYFYRTLGGGA